MTEPNAIPKMLTNDYATHPLIDGMRRVGTIDRYFDMPITASAIRCKCGPWQFE